MFSLGEILKEAGLVDSHRIEKLSIWWYDEGRFWHLIQPYGRPWNVKTLRPFLVVGDDENFVYIVMMSTKRFICEGLEERDMELDIDKCEIEPVGRCNWIRKKSNVFVRRLNTHCRIVLRIPKAFLETVAGRCGLCSEEILSEEIRIFIDREMEEWRRRS